MLTVVDVVRNLIDFIGANPEESPLRDAKRSLLDAYEEIANAHTWNYLKTFGRLNTVAPYSTGTVVYDHTGGASERLLTLTGGTWPTWVGQGDVVRIGDVSYLVATRVDGTKLTLDSTLNPGADVAATSYLLYRDTFDLPADFRSGKTPIFETGLGGLTYQDPQAYLFNQRAWSGVGWPNIYTIVGSAVNLGRLSIRFSPAPDQAQTLDYLYYRRPRALTVIDQAEGSVSVASGSASLTGTGTNWNNSIVGAVLRLSADSRAKPTDRIGNNPYSHEARIVSVASTTAAVIDTVVPSDYTNVKLQISDPIDLEGMLLVAFQRMAERNMAINRRHEDKGAILAAADMALRKAREADNRSHERRNAGMGSETYFQPRFGSDQ